MQNNAISFATGGTNAPPSTTQPVPGPQPPIDVALAPPPGGGGIMPPPPPGSIGAAAPPPGAKYPTRTAPPAGGGQFSGQRTVGAEAGPADYQGVQGFADQAYQQARRNIDPMQEQARRRTEQDLINKGVDPSSPQGRAMLDQQARNFADQDNAATFGALQFGQGIQQQMFDQAYQNTVQAGNMQQAKWGYDINRGNQNLLQQNQDFNQMLGLEGIDFRNRAYNDKQDQYYDQLTLSLMGQTPIPGYGGYDPTGLAGQQIAGSSGGGIISAF